MEFKRIEAGNEKAEHDGALQADSHFHRGKALMMNTPQDVKRALLGIPPQVKCNHQGFIVPTLLIPHLIEVPPQEKPVEGEAPKAPAVVQLYKTMTASCVRCGQVFNFGVPPAPEAVEKAPEVAP